MNNFSNVFLCWPIWPPLLQPLNLCNLLAFWGAQKAWCVCVSVFVCWGVCVWEGEEDVCEGARASFSGGSIDLLRRNYTL